MSAARRDIPDGALAAAVRRLVVAAAQRSGTGRENPRREATNVDEPTGGVGVDRPRRTAELAVPQKLGILPERWARAARAHPARADPDGPRLSPAVKRLPRRRV